MVIGRSKPSSATVHVGMPQHEQRVHEHPRRVPQRRRATSPVQPYGAENDRPREYILSCRGVISEVEGRGSRLADRKLF
jgi:hypothetical protein